MRWIFILKREKISDILQLASKKDPGFDLYWFAIALQRAEDFPDKIESWPVEVLLPWSPAEIKKKFLEIASDIMEKIKDR